MTPPRLRLAPALALLLALGGCVRPNSGPPAPPCTGRGEAPLTPAFLAGIWELELRVTNRNEWDRGFGLDRYVAGTVSLDVTGVAPGALEAPLDCAACVRGYADIPLDSVLRRPPASWQPSGTVLRSEQGLSAATLRLAMYDNIASLVLTGERAGALVCGRWAQASLDFNERGTFVLRRPARTSARSSTTTERP